MNGMGQLDRKRHHQTDKFRRRLTDARNMEEEKKPCGEGLKPTDTITIWDITAGGTTKREIDFLNAGEPSHC